ncbi:hypothetical protein MRX96_043255 [Rhipicephalus microplus]
MAKGLLPISAPSAGSSHAAPKKHDLSPSGTRITFGLHFRRSFAASITAAAFAPHCSLKHPQPLQRRTRASLKRVAPRLDLAEGNSAARNEKEFRKFENFLARE